MQQWEELKRPSRAPKPTAEHRQRPSASRAGDGTLCVASAEQGQRHILRRDVESRPCIATLAQRQRQRKTRNGDSSEDYAKEVQATEPAREH